MPTCVCPCSEQPQGPIPTGPEVPVSTHRHNERRRDLKWSSREERARCRYLGWAPSNIATLLAVHVERVHVLLPYDPEHDDAHAAICYSVHCSSCFCESGRFMCARMSRSALNCAQKQLHVRTHVTKSNNLGEVSPDRVSWCSFFFVL
jgi:hypothetical protein